MVRAHHDPEDGYLPHVRFHRGEVVLAGAGPGDRGLVTLRALAYLRQADVILYDRLTDHSVLRFARKDAERVNAGKGHRTTSEQDWINEQMLDRAQKGRRVLRWKGGDPYVFGRGWEEKTYLESHGVRVTYVPGVSSITSLPGLAGISVLTRGVASSLGLFTGEIGHSAHARHVRLRALAGASDTLVGVMVVEHLPLIVEKLLAVRPPSEPAALIERGATPRQRVLRAPLGHLVAVARRHHLQAPAVLVVGPTAGETAGGPENGRGRATSNARAGRGPGRGSPAARPPKG